MVDITMNGRSFCKLASCQMEHEARLIDGFVIARYPRLKRNRLGRTYSTDFLFPEFDLLWNSAPDCEISMIWLASHCQAICSIRRGNIYLAKLKLFCFRVMAEGIVLIRLEICRDRRDRRSCKIFVSCVNFSRKQRSFFLIL